MNQDDNINSAFDAKLSRLFAEKNEPLLDDEFMTQMLPRLERAYSAQRIRHIFLLMAVLLLAAFLAPLATRMTIELFLFAGTLEMTPTMNAILMTGMLVVTLGVFVWSRRRI